MTLRPRAHVAAALGFALVLIGFAASSRIRHRPLLAARYVTAGAVRIRYVRDGRGQTVVLIHGYGESLVAWRSVFGPLAQHADVIALDLPGFGLSSKPPTGYATDSIAAAVDRALAELGVRRAVIVGHSLGGAVAAALVVRDSAIASRLVLIDGAVVGAPVPVPESRQRERSVEAVRSAIAFYEATRPVLTPPHDPDWFAETPEDAAYLPSHDPSYKPALAAVLREFDFDWLTPDRARRLRLPTLVVWGEFDALFPLPLGKQLVATLPDARLVIIPRAWHRPHEERPDEVASVLLEFIGSGGGQSPSTP